MKEEERWKENGTERDGRELEIKAENAGRERREIRERERMGGKNVWEKVERMNR